MERINNKPAARSGNEANRRDEVEKSRTGLVGREAALIDMGAWVDGRPLTGDDLKGKVVLLDF